MTVQSTISTVKTSGLLFDMDGTLLDSTATLVATWEHFATKYDLNLEEVLKTSHGVKTKDNLRNFCGITDEKELEIVEAEFEAMSVYQAKRLKAEGRGGLMVLPGVQQLLATLEAAATPMWAIVTSASRSWTLDALPSIGIPIPKHLITADEAPIGKPDPAPYFAGAGLLGLDIENCIVVEDAPSGLRAGVASGAPVLAVCTSHDRSVVESFGPKWIVKDLSRVTVTVEESGEISLIIDQRED